ncbi:unnamed protein product [Parascedosporium putredinis]|uniref:Uncharacterized protein n=1 Tax=Parascedosporium putredinis TaxID=1442378 RepID=A0A9P1GYQ7_9PEZI|nr:unnamed protein product [Parascedosporium putredinis]CAI7992007.1 unnamed protein product [Parascedosporium putredinis]
MTAAWVVDGERAAAAGNQKFNIAVSGGIITCIGQCHAELEAAALCEGCVISIPDGHLTAAFTAFGSGLGLNEIESEGVTDNGADGTIFSRGVDGLALNTTKLQVAGRYGVTRAISAPRFIGPGTHHGTSVEFLTGAVTQLDQGAVIHRDAAVHYTLDLSAKRVGSTPSMSAAISVLRDKLLDAVDAMGEQSSNRSERKSEGAFLRRVVIGDLALAITAHSADIIASLLTVKADVEAAIARLGRDSKLRLTIIGGAEAHLVADKLAAAGALTGAPLTEHTAVDVLLRAGVTTALGLEEDWVVRDLGVLASVAFNNGEGRLNETGAFDLVSRNVYELLGLPVPD